jgi:chromate transporter
MTSIDQPLARPASPRELFVTFTLIALQGFGGVLAVAQRTAIPDMRRMMVSDMGLLSDTQFTSSIAIALAAPGPNTLLVAAIGYQAAGLAGAAAMLLGILLPSTTMGYAAARWSQARGECRLLRAFKSGTAPIVIALPFATGWILAAQTPVWTSLVLTVATALLVWLTRIHILILIAAGAVLGAMGLI